MKRNQTDENCERKGKKKVNHVRAKSVSQKSDVNDGSVEIR